MKLTTRFRRISAIFLMVIVEAIAIMMPIQATAQTAQAVASNAATAAINKLTMGAGTYAAGSVAAQAEAAILTAAGKSATVAVTAKVAMDGAKMAGFATKALRLGTFVGVATIVLPWLYQQSGYHTCPPPDFFCKSVKGYATDVTGWNCGFPLGTPSTNYNSSISSCAAAMSSYYNGSMGVNNWKYYDFSGSANDMSGTLTISRISSDGSPSYLTTPMSRTSAQVPTYRESAITDPEMNKSVTDYVGTDEAKRKKLYDTLVADKVPDMFAANDTVVITAPPVTLDPVVKTEKISNPGGGTSTKTTTLATTVTPVQVGTTIGDGKLKLNETTTTTTVIKDDATAATTTTTGTETNTSNPVAPAQQFPTDYNREVTQQAMQKELVADAAPTLENQKPIVTTTVDKADADLQAKRVDVLNEQQSDKGKFFDWLWTPPVGSCSSPTGTVHGLTVSIDICPTVTNIKDVIAWLFGIGTLISVYNQLFKKGED